MNEILEFLFKTRNLRWTNVKKVGQINLDIGKTKCEFGQTSGHFSDIAHFSLSGFISEILDFLFKNKY